MRKLIPCYLTGFKTTRQLQGQLFQAQTLADWQAAVSNPERWGFDPLEPYAIEALRKSRYKGSGQRQAGAQHKVVLPVGWLSEEQEGGEVPEWLDEASCEG